MKYYRILVLGVQGKGKNVFKSPQVIPEDKFIDGSVEGLIKGGYIKEESGNNIIKDSDKARKFEEVKKEYLELTGQNEVNGRWGLPRLSEELDRLKFANSAAAYKSATGIEPKKEWDLAKINSELEAYNLTNLRKQYYDQFGEDADEGLTSDQIAELIQKKTQDNN